MNENAKPERKTSYIVLSGHEGAWRKVSTVDAVSADAAIRDVAAGTDAPTGCTFVAVPARSWKPREVTVETQPRVKLS